MKRRNLLIISKVLCRKRGTRPGRNRCENLHNLKGASFSIEMMRFDAPDRRSVDIRYKNLEALRFRAWEIKTLPENLNFYDEDERKKYFQRKPDFAWEVELPETTNLREKIHSIIPPIDEFGHYLVHAYVDATSPSKAGHFGLLTLNNLVVRYAEEGGKKKFESTSRRYRSSNRWCKDDFVQTCGSFGTLETRWSLQDR